MSQTDEVRQRWSSVPSTAISDIFNGHDRTTSSLCTVRDMYPACNELNLAFVQMSFSKHPQPTESLR